MMIYLQDRSRVTPANSDMFILQIPDDSYLIVKSYGDNEIVLGEYESEKFAIEVLRRIFQAIKDKKPSYCMPEFEEIEPSYSICKLYGFTE